MRIAPLPPDEDVRIAALRRYEILDSEPEEAFERITSLAQRLFDVPICVVSLVDVDRQWFKSCIGLDARSTSRDVSFCAHAILADEVMVVPDATLDPRFAGNPDVLGGPTIRFYAGAPLKTPEGASLGTLCLIDDRPRAGLSAEERRTLTDLANVVVDAMELRLSLRRSVEREEELRRAQAAAQEASAARSRFLSRMSHEFRTPLNAILGFVQLLQGEDLTPDQKEDLAHMRRAGDQLLHLLTEALDLTRLESGKVRMTIEDVALAPVVGAAVRAAGRDEVALDVPPDLRVLADTRRLEDALAELLRNAVAHAGPDASVGVSASAGDGTVDLVVRDHGTGMDAETLSRVFAPFEIGRMDGPGIGLGLTVVQRTLQAMGGSVTASSEVGKGTTVTISLPAGTSGAAAPDAEGPSILYVDDNPSNLRLVEKILVGYPGLRLHLATTGAGGVGVAAEELPDLVLLDLYLPDVSGDEVLASLKNDSRTAGTPVIVVTVEDDPAVAARLRALGAADVITKPFDANKLAEVMTTHLADKVVRSGA